MTKAIYTILLQEALEKFNNKECFHIKRGNTYQTWTYNELYQDINALSDTLRSSGFSKNQKALLIGPNTPEWVIAYHAIIGAQGQVVPLDPNLSAEEIKTITSVTEPTVIFCAQEYLSTFQHLQNEFSSIKSIICFQKRERVCDYESFLGTGDKNRKAFSEEVNPEDEVAILFTSGTTGTPKGVVLQQKNLFTIGKAIPELLQIEPGSDEKILAVLPLYHVFGFAASIVATVTNGLQAVFVPELKGNLILEALNDKEVTILPAIPQLLTIFYQNIQSKVRNSGPIGRTLFSVLSLLSNTIGTIGGAPLKAKIYKRVHKGFGGKLRIIVSGGASLDKETFEGFTKMGFTVLEGYGLTETFGPISLCPIYNPVQGTVGPVIPPNEVTIDAPEGEQGEILLRGDCVFPGYYNNPEATAEVIDEEGWFHSGDIGYLDRNGYIVISGRKKEIIVLSSGKNLFPDELEQQYLSLPYIEELSIFGVKEGSSEKAVALIVPSIELRSKYDEEDITNLFKEKFHDLHKNKTSYKIFSDFAVTKHPLPRTSTRKAIKGECRKIYEEIKNNQNSTARVVKLSVKEESLMNTPLFKTIHKAIIEQRGATVDITPKTTFGVDVSMDSLTFTALISNLEEKLKRRLPQEKLAMCDTVGDLYLAINSCAEKVQKKGAQTILVKPNGFFARLLNNNIAALCRVISKVTWNLKVEGNKNLSGGPYIFVSNHQSNLDPGWILTQFPDKLRNRTYTLGKDELSHIPFIHYLFKLFNILPIDRFGQFSDAVERAEELLNNNNSILLFPEGTRSIDGKLKEFKTGVGHIALATKATIVPIKVKGSYEIWPKGATSPKLFTRKTIKSTLTLGTPIPFSTFSDDASPQDISEYIRNIIEQL